MQGDWKFTFLHSQNLGHKCFVLLGYEHTLWPLLSWFYLPTQVIWKGCDNMCRNLLAFFKDSCPLSIASIATSNTLEVHLPHYVKLGILLIVSGFFTCAGIVGGMFSLFVNCLSCKLFHLLRGIMDIMVLIPCFLVLASNKLGCLI
jgi:hypothetical protein